MGFGVVRFLLPALPLALLACKADPPRRAVLATWSGSELTLADGRGTGTVSAAGAKYVLELRDLPRRTRYRAGSVRGVATTGSARIELDLRSALGRTPIDRVYDVRLGERLVLDMPDGGRVETSLTGASARPAIPAIFQNVVVEPVRLGDESPDPGAADALIWIPDDASYEVLGRGITFADIDWVVLARPADEPRRKSCGVFEADRPSHGLHLTTPHRFNAVLEMRDAIVEIYDRRTGTRIRQQVIAPSEECPKVVRGKKRPDGSVVVEATWPYREIDAWVRALLPSAA